jgi:predicted RNA binding protein YcfA (HicA-like mRNA interferase family)
MKRRDLIRHIEVHGCELLREGGNHSVYVNRVLGDHLLFHVIEKLTVILPAKSVAIYGFLNHNLSITSTSKPHGSRSREQNFNPGRVDAESP